MHRAFSYRLRPTKSQERRMVALLDAQREVYNAALEERRGAWTWERRRVTKFEQYGQVKELREARPEVTDFGVTVTRGTLSRLDEAFQGFFRRVRAGQTPGYPRFKGRGRWTSVSWPDASGWKVDEDARRLYLQGVGHIRLRLHQPLRGEARTITVRRSGRHWDVTVFCANVAARPLPATGHQVGIDLGVSVLLATSDGDLIP
ncbi:MAG: helix-turn-helix domain-containing protein, partial [Actinomycetota bacterium]|nr:helix-turn-helix domain-containing protein [Actinomycetota bacterium]